MERMDRTIRKKEKKPDWRKATRQRIGAMMPSGPKTKRRKNIRLPSVERLREPGSDMKLLLGARQAA